MTKERLGTTVLDRCVVFSVANLAENPLDLADCHGEVRKKKTDYLTVLAGIPPAELRRRQATLTLARRALEPNHLLHHKIISPELRQSRRLKSRHPFVPASRELLPNLNQLDIRAADWAEHSGRSEWNNCNTRLHHFICNIDTPPPGMHLPRRSWMRLNHLRTGVGRFHSSLHN